MMTLKTKQFLFSGALSIALLTNVAMPAFAEEAPVYDVDSYPPQFDGQNPQAAGPQTAAPQAVGPQAKASQENNGYDSSAQDPNAGQSDASAQGDPNAGPDYANPEQEPQAAPRSTNAESTEQPAYLQGSPPPAVSTSTQATPSASANIPTYEPPPPNLSVGQRVTRLEHQLSNAMNSDSFTKFTEMQAQIQALRGEVEQLNHQLDLLQKQQKAMYSDLEKRVNHSPTISEDNYEETGNPKPKVIAVKTPAATQPNSAEEQQIYQQAYSLIKAKKYSQAAATFEKMLKKYPSGQFAANAHYWLGELYGLMGNNDKASVEFNTVVTNYPTSAKIADAQLKLGLIYTSQQKWSDAKSSFKKVITNFPGTSFARLATEQLKQIKSLGH